MSGLLLHPNPDFGAMLLPPNENAQSEDVDITMVVREPGGYSDMQAQAPLQHPAASRAVIVSLRH